jgi:Flp pilus assembly protein TadD
MTHRHPALPAVAALLFASLVASYAGGLGGPFVFDDQVSIVENPTLRTLWPPRVPLSPPTETPVAGRPLANLSFAVSFAVGGLNPWGYRALNLLLHGLVALGLFALVRRTLERCDTPSATGCAAATALLFALHPLTSECILYATQRTELLAGCFVLATLLAAERVMRARARFGLAGALAVVCSALGMACKESAAIAPIAVWLYDGAYGAGGLARALRARAPLYAGLACSWGVWLLLNRSGPRQGSVGYELGVSASSYLAHQMELVPTYLARVVWPDPLVLDYGWPLPLAWSEVGLELLGVALTLAGSAALFLWRPTLGTPLALGWLALLPSSSLVPIATEVGAERRMYLPLACLLALGTFGVSGGLQRALPAERARAVGIGVTLALVLALGATTRARTRDYQSKEVLWRGVVAARPGQPRPLVNLGSALREAGRPDEARTHFDAALELWPAYARAEAQLALLAQDRGDFAEAERHLRRALARDPGDGRARNNLGELLARRGATGEAILAWREALARDPSLALSANNLAWTLATHPDASVRDGNEAVALGERAVALTGGTDAALLDTLAAAYAESGRFEDAIRTLEHALGRSPEPGLRFGLEARLRGYREGRPYRVPGLEAPPLRP